LVYVTDRRARILSRAHGHHSHVGDPLWTDQCTAAVPSVFNIIAPRGLEDFTRWILILTLPSDLEDIVIPTACLGTYRKRIWLGSCWPIVLTLLFAAGYVCREALRERGNDAS
jgi:hypothetical protein